jgi:hypothetical protein
MPKHFQREARMNTGSVVRQAATPFRLFIAALGAAACAYLAQAAYLDQPGDDVRSGPRPPPHLPPPVVRPVPPHNPVGEWLRMVRVAPPYSYGGLTIFPLVGIGRRFDPAISTLEEALAAGGLDVRERDSSTVDAVDVRNNSGRHVLLLAGESLLGGKQNRILRNDVLLRPESGFVTVPVFCGEKERWSGESASFGKAGELAHPSLRRQAVAGASQEALWTEIDAQSARARVSSPTRDYQMIYADPNVSREIDRHVAECRRRWPADVVGFVAADSGAILGCDVLPDPELFERLRDRLVRGYAVEMVCRPARGSWTRVTQSAVQAYIARAADAAAAEISAPGEGTLYRLAGEVDGQALVWRNRVVHAVFFGGGAVEPPRPPVFRPLRPQDTER